MPQRPVTSAPVCLHFAHFLPVGKTTEALAQVFLSFLCPGPLLLLHGPCGQAGSCVWGSVSVTKGGTGIGAPCVPGTMCFARTVAQQFRLTSTGTNYPFPVTRLKEPSLPETQGLAQTPRHGSYSCNVHFRSFLPERMPLSFVFCFPVC